MHNVLFTLDLVPSNGDCIVDTLVRSKPKIAEKTMTVRLHDSKNAIMLPQFRSSAKQLSVARGDKLASLLSTMSCVYSGRWNELHANHAIMAVIRRADSRALLFDASILGDVKKYITDVQERGVTLIQAVDIICNKLSQ